MANYFIGEIILYPITFVPVGWLPCDGSLISIADNGMLFQLLGTTYGGDGSNTFGLPDLRGRVPLHQGTAPGMQSYAVGQTGGSNTVTLSTGQLPQHTHTMSASGNAGDTNVPANGVALASTGPASQNLVTDYAVGGQATQVNLSGPSVGNAGGNQPHANVQPSMAIQYIICNSGVFPPRPN